MSVTDLRERILGYILRREARHIEETGIPYAFSRTEIAERFRISRYTAAKILDELVEEGRLYRVMERVYFPIWYYYPYFYRTQVAAVVYAREPERDTPDPIAEVRVVCVSDRPGRYKKENLEKALLHALVLLNPRSYWLEKIDIGDIYLEYIANEQDEPIEVDEVTDSLPCYWKVGYCERLAVFYRSKRGKWLRDYEPYWYLDIRTWTDVVRRRLDEVAVAMYGRRFDELGFREKEEVIYSPEVQAYLLPGEGDYLYPESKTAKLMVKISEWRHRFAATGRGPSYGLAIVSNTTFEFLEAVRLRECTVYSVFSNVEGRLIRVKPGPGP